MWPPAQRSPSRSLGRQEGSREARSLRCRQQNVVTRALTTKPLGAQRLDIRDGKLRQGRARPELRSPLLSRACPATVAREGGPHISWLPSEPPTWAGGCGSVSPGPRSRVPPPTATQGQARPGPQLPGGTQARHSAGQWPRGTRSTHQVQDLQLGLLPAQHCGPTGAPEAHTGPRHSRPPDTPSLGRGTGKGVYRLGQVGGNSMPLSRTETIVATSLWEDSSASQGPWGN